MEKERERDRVLQVYVYVYHVADGTTKGADAKAVGRMIRPSVEWKSKLAGFECRYLSIVLPDLVCYTMGQT